MYFLILSLVLFIQGFYSYFHSHSIQSMLALLLSLEYNKLIPTLAFVIVSRACILPPKICMSDSFSSVLSQHKCHIPSSISLPQRSTEHLSHRSTILHPSKRYKHIKLNYSIIFVFIFFFLTLTSKLPKGYFFSL